MAKGCDVEDRAEIGYFEARRVALPTGDMSVPAWLLSELGSRLDSRILDVGCGQGRLIQALHAEGFSNVSGLEIDRVAIEHCASQGLAVRSHDLTRPPPSDLGVFDFIILLHVLEHMPKDEIVNVLRNLSLLLSERGRLLVAVPNAQSNTGSYWAFEDFTHSTIFTTGSLYYVTKMAGLSKCEILDRYCSAGTSPVMKIARFILMKLYEGNISFWNKVTRSSFHNESEHVFSYEIKARLSK